MKEYEPKRDNANPREGLFALILCSIFLWVIYSTSPSTASAQCYRLTDGRGTIHFTDTIYQWTNEKGQLYYTNYFIFLPPEKYLAIVKEIETGPPSEEIKGPSQFVQDSGDIMTEMKKRF
ncbi:MAG: hypothetical protein V1689_13195 [Pseudomonadota bacterium]